MIQLSVMLCRFKAAAAKLPTGRPAATAPQAAAAAPKAAPKADKASSPALWLAPHPALAHVQRV